MALAWSGNGHDIWQVGGMVSERFRRTLRGGIRSTEGFTVRLAGRTVLLYTRNSDSLRLNTEVMAGPGIRVVLYADSIPHVSDIDPLLVVRDIERAFQYAGWDLMVNW